MRNYQRKVNNPYLLPHNLYVRVKYLVRDYDRLKSEMEDILHEMPKGDTRGTPVSASNPVAEKAVRRERLRKDLEAVDQATLVIPEEYRKGVLNHVKYGVRFPDYGERKTWFAHQAKFLYYIAVRLGEL